MKTTLFAIAFAVFASVSQTGPAYAERWIFVNDQRLSDSEIAQLEASNCTGIPHGRYLIANGHYRNEQWAPNVWLPLGYCCYNNCRRPSLSERGLLFSPGELLK